MRTALGARRGGIVGAAALGEPVLALAGGALGLLLARARRRAGGAVRSGRAFRGWPQAALDGRLFLFALGGLARDRDVCSASRRRCTVRAANLNAALSERRPRRHRRPAGTRLRNALVVAEVALAVLVLIGAGLLIRSFVAAACRRIRASSPRACSRCACRWPAAGIRAAERRIAFLQQVTDRMAALPGVRARRRGQRAAADRAWASAPTSRWTGRPAPPADAASASALLRSVTPGLLPHHGIPLLAGRDFTDADTPQSPAGDRGEPDSGAPFLARRERRRRQHRDRSMPTSTCAEIVGVVGDVKPERIEGEDWPTIYSPYPQMPLRP